MEGLSSYAGPWICVLPTWFYDGLRTMLPIKVPMCSSPLCLAGGKGRETDVQRSARRHGGWPHWHGVEGRRRLPSNPSLGEGKLVGTCTVYSAIVTLHQSCVANLASSGGFSLHPLYINDTQQISDLAPDTMECCSLVRTLGLRLTERLSDGDTAVADGAEGFFQATADVDVGAGKNGAVLRCRWHCSLPMPQTGRRLCTETAEIA